ncbi:MAG: ferritin family protein [Magnetococcales bacterium]|nr:ferritin family protein [Magnetococcales bacterium]
METAIELLKTVIGNEVAVSSFYSVASELVKDGEVQMVFLELSGMEDSYAQKIVDKFKDAPCSKGFDPQEYLANLPEDVYTADIGTSKILKNSTVRQVLEMAISHEKTSKDSYDQLEKIAIDPEMKTVCRELSKTEEQHILQLTELINSLDMDPDERPPL